MRVYIGKASDDQDQPRILPQFSYFSKYIIRYVMPTYMANQREHGQAAAAAVAVRSASKDSQSFLKNKTGKRSNCPTFHGSD
jgi:hypothetical protein